jgi:nitrogen fixation NifU-like protein
MDKIDQKLLDHFHNPKNVGIIENPDGYGNVENPVCGDLTDIYIKVEKGRIKDIKFKSYGCHVTIASASALTEAIKGKKLDEIIKNKEPVKMLMRIIMKEFKVISKAKMHCPPASIQALLMAIADYYEKKSNIDMVKKIKKDIDGINDFYMIGRK